MPFLLGYGVVDASANTLQDASANDLGEPNTDMSWLATQVPGQQQDILTRLGIPTTSIVQMVLDIINDIAVTGAVPPVTIGAAIGNALVQLIDPASATPTIAQKVTAIDYRTDPGSAGYSNLFQALVAIRDLILTAVQNVRTDTATPHLATVQDVLDALAGLPLNPVNLPPTPPAGYGGATPAAIWNYTLLNTYAQQLSADQALSWAGLFAENIGPRLTTPIADAPDFALWKTSGWEDYHFPNTSTLSVTPDYTDIHPADTVLTWLQRTEPNGYTWAQFAGSDLCWALWGATAPWNDYKLVCRLHDSDLQRIRLKAGGGIVPPIWPGLAGVTLGTPVALGPSVTVPGPLHGVVIAISAVGTNRQWFSFGADKSYVRIGAITFQTDDGQDEYSQLLGFQQAIYCPRTMAIAQSALLRCGSDVVGTVTPWLLTP